MTTKQALVLEFIRMYIEMKGFSPSLQDIAHGVGLRSKWNIHRIVHTLKRMNHLTVGTGFRAIKVR